MNFCFVRLAGRNCKFPATLGMTSATLVVTLASTTGAQVVTPKTVPIRQDFQFAIYPSTRAGMADAGLALDDTLADPFVNPAKATLIRSGVVFATPFTHGVTAGRGGGTTLPIGGFLAANGWVGGGVLAVQQLNHAGGQTISQRTAANQYANVVVAKRVGNSVSIGASAFVAGLNAVDGVDLLYQGNDRLLQQGSVIDARLGAMKMWNKKRLDAEIVHSRTDVDQDVHYTRQIWNQGASGFVTTTSEDHNVDKTIIWSGHTQYTQLIGDEGWRFALLATGSRLSHPKIPNYQIQNIPRDPGTTWGFNVGFGIARSVGKTTFALDLVQEPIFADTWGKADRDTAIVGGGVIPSGGRTVSNRFAFSNSHTRIGVERDFGTDSSGRFGFQFGLAAYSINYRLHQTNHVQRTERWQDEGWTEWTPTFGLRWIEKSFSLQYSYRRTCGPSECVDFGMGDKITVPPATGGVIAAPSGPLNINGGTAHTHRFMLVVPVR